MAAVQIASTTPVQDAMLNVACSDMLRQVHDAIAGVNCVSPHVDPSQPFHTKYAPLTSTFFARM